MSEPQSPLTPMATIDLSGRSGGGQTFGRIAGGLALLIGGGLLAIACGVGWVAVWFVPSLWDWVELIGDGLLFIGAIALGLAILGFEILRRGRRSRKAMDAETTAAWIRAGQRAAQQHAAPQPQQPAADPTTPPKAIL